MAAITNELIYEVLKSLQEGQARLEHGLGEVQSELRTVRHHVAGPVESDLRRDGELAALKLRVERIERRLELSD